jgi:Rieske Fe-S protein
MLFLLIILFGIIYFLHLNDKKNVVNNKKENNKNSDRIVTVHDDHVVVNQPNKPQKKLSRRCPHAGCNVNYENNKFVCPCHQSKFNLEGHVLQGPAESDLDPY